MCTHNVPINLYVQLMRPARLKVLQAVLISYMIYICIMPPTQVDILVHLIKVCELRGECVTVLTPYSAQVECIKQRLTQERAYQKRVKDHRTVMMLDSVRVQTINDSQGWCP